MRFHKGNSYVVSHSTCKEVLWLVFCVQVLVPQHFPLTRRPSGLHLFHLWAQQACIHIRHPQIICYIVVLKVLKGSFVPLVYTTTGGMGQQCARTHKRIAELVADRKNEKYTDFNLKKLVISEQGSGSPC